MATFSYTPDFALELEEEPRVLRSAFGDGYEQRAGDGINIRPLKYSLRFITRTDTEADNILTFLRARNGSESFDWTPYGGTAGKYVCDSWRRSYNAYNQNEISCIFRQVFDL